MFNLRRKSLEWVTTALSACQKKLSDKNSALEKPKKLYFSSLFRAETCTALIMEGVGPAKTRSCRVTFHEYSAQHAMASHHKWTSKEAADEEAGCVLASLFSEKLAEHLNNPRPEQTTDCHWTAVNNDSWGFDIYRRPVSKEILYCCVEAYDRSLLSNIWAILPNILREMQAIENLEPRREMIASAYRLLADPNDRQEPK